MKIEISLSAAAGFAPKVGFRNKVQVALYNEELKGQISDGLWENSRPSNHYKQPTRAKVFVAKQDVELGPNFLPDRAYNFASPLLIEYVGDRMLAVAQSVDKSMDMPRMKAELRDMTKIFNAKFRGVGVPAAPSTRVKSARTSTPSGSPRASPIKDTSNYSWYLYGGARAVTVSRRGTDTPIKKGMKFGLRASSSGKAQRLIFPGAETLVYTLTPEQVAALLKGSKATRV